MATALKILIGYDGSEGGDDALELGRILLEGLGGEALVATMLRIPGYLLAPTDLEIAIEREANPLFEIARDRLAGFEAQALSGADASPGRALKQTIAREAPAIAVIGSSRRGPVGRVAVGDVGGDMLLGASCAVALAPVGYAAREEHRLREIAIAMDGGDESWNAFETAALLAARLHAQLTAILVARPAHYGYGEAAEILTNGRRERSETRRLREVADRAAVLVPDIVPFRQVFLEEDDVAAAIATAAERLDLLVIGSRGYGPVRGALLGSVSRRLARLTRCPLLIVPRGAGDDPLGLAGRRATTAAAAGSR